MIKKYTMTEITTKTSVKKCSKCGKPITTLAFVGKNENVILCAKCRKGKTNDK
jgi:formylmethanofuran dehydrogenase subunit E